MRKVKHTPLSPILAESLEHGARVAQYAKALFMGLAPEHKLSKKWLRILYLGAQLHDIGWLYGKQGHHKASAAMIRAGQIDTEQALPISVPKDIRHLVALVARYHRRAEPSLEQARFAALTAKEQKAMLYLASIIRLADALDFSHTGAVQKVRAHLHAESLLLKLTCNKACQSEVSRIAIKKELFCKVFQKDVLCNHTVIL